MTREQIDRAIAAGETRSAHAALGVYWRENPTLAAASFVLSRFEPLRAALPPAACRLAILRSFTVEPVVLLLRAAAAVSGIDLQVQVGGFNAHAQEVLDAGSDLWRPAPDVAILAVQSRDVAPDLWHEFPRLSRGQVSAAVARVSQDFRQWVAACRSRWTCHIIVHTLETPFRPSSGILDWQQGGGQTAAFREINRSLAELPAAFPGVYLLDYDGLVAQHGRLSWHDERNWVTSRLPISADHLIHLASEWLRYLLPLTARTCKALAIDLDQTLWGGVIGEDGLAGIRLGKEHPGAAFRNLQRAVLDLRERGVLLAICSRNDAAEALEALETHPEMLLRPSHFAAMRINWNAKDQNLREIAAELNLGLDAIAFLDDDPAERELIRSQLPEVTVLDLPRDPDQRERALREAPVFERLALSEEDGERHRYYAEQRRRGDLRLRTPSIDEFYRSLQMRAEIAPAGARSAARIAQLTQKTNQFNLTGRRYGEAQILGLAEQAGWRVYSVALWDRFGDSGIVGVAITRALDGTHEIDTFLLSCRVIGRTLERAMLAFLADRARADGAARLAGEFIAGGKNAPARGFYAACGFNQVAERDGGSRWELDLANGVAVEAPPWIQVSGR